MCMRMCVPLGDTRRPHLESRLSSIRHLQQMSIYQEEKLLTPESPAAHFRVSFKIKV